LDVQNWLERDGIRIMEMEWVDGFDLARLLTKRMYHLLEQRVKPIRWQYINEVIVTAGPVQPRLKPASLWRLSGIVWQVSRRSIEGGSSTAMSSRRTSC